MCKCPISWITAHQVGCGPETGFESLAPLRSLLTANNQLPRLATMEVHLTPEQEAELSKLATRKGRNANELAQEVIGFYLEHEARFIEAVKRGLESLDRGEYVSHEEVGARIDRLFPS